MLLAWWCVGLLDCDALKWIDGYEYWLHTCMVGLMYVFGTFDLVFSTFDVCVCVCVELYVNCHDTREIGDVCITLSLCVTLWLRLIMFRFCRVVLGMMKQVRHWHEIWHGACHENASWWNLGMEMKKALRSRRESRRWRKK